MTPILALVLRILILLLLYTFIGWIGYIVFSDIKTFLRKQTKTPVPKLLLSTTRMDKRYEKLFNPSKVVIGRDPDCEFSIPDETISLRHCELDYHHQQWWANDLDSTNGSYLNDNLIDSPVVITDNDILRLGNVLIKIQFIS